MLLKLYCGACVVVNQLLANILLYVTDFSMLKYAIFVIYYVYFQ